ncbi:helix-turn-helix domain-containing protein [Nitrosomonas marina]|nr:helix-turn-helix domain-containing protein [Nitrosomonas marina]
MEKFNNQFPPIEQVTRTAVTTNEAAFYLNRKPQTLRIWAMNENGLIRPIRINGRLAWPVSEIKQLLGVEG